MLSAGMFSALAAAMAVRKRGLPSGSPPPLLAAMVISLITRVKILPRLASSAPFLCLIVAHFEWPDMVMTRLPISRKIPPITLKNFADNIQVVLFDLGGVLVELRGVSTMLAWLDHRVSLEELWKLWLSSPTVRRFETGRTTPAEFAEQIIREMSLPIAPEEFVANFESWVVGLLPGALDLVHSVPSRFTRATLTNTSDPHWRRLITR